MIAIRCKSCNSNDIELRKGMAICRSCGTRYVLEKNDRDSEERTIRIVIPTEITDRIEQRKSKIAESTADLWNRVERGKKSGGRVTKRQLLLLALSFVALLLIGRIEEEQATAAEARALSERTGYEYEDMVDFVKSGNDPTDMIRMSDYERESEGRTEREKEEAAEQGRREALESEQWRQEYDRSVEERDAGEDEIRAQLSSIEAILAHDRAVWEKDRESRSDAASREEESIRREETTQQTRQTETDRRSEEQSGEPDTSGITIDAEEAWAILTAPSPYRERDNAAVAAQMAQAEEERLRWVEEHRKAQEGSQSEQAESGDTAESASTQVSDGNPVKPIVNGSGFNEIRVGEQYLGNTYFQTENRGSRMEGFDEFYYVNEH